MAFCSIYVRISSKVKALLGTVLKIRGFQSGLIHAELKKKGSPDSIIEADDEHTYFIIRIRCHPEFVCEELSMDKDGHILPVGEVWTSDVTDNVTDNVTDKFSDGNSIEKRRAEMMHLMRLTPKIPTDYLANILHVYRRTIARDVNFLREQGKLRRDGDDRSGVWVVLE